MNKPKLSGHHDAIRTAREQGHSYRAIADQLDVNKDTVANYVKRHLPGLVSPPNTQPTAVTFDFESAPSELELAQTELKALRKLAKKHRSIDVQAEMLRQEVLEAVVPADVTFEAPEVAAGDGKAHMQVLLLSDLHIGEVVVPEAVNGLNEYNWEIFQERMENVHKSLISYQNNRPYPIDELLIGLLGDNVSNNHHKELEVTNEFPIAQQCSRGGMFLARWIESLVPHYPRIRVEGVGGNHGRVDKNPSSKHVFDSFDWLGYQFIEQHLRNYPTLEMRFPMSGMAVTDVVGRNMLLWHGDGVRSSMPGVPWGGVTRRANTLKAQYSKAGVPLDYIAFGHYHQANVIQGWLFGNGSIIGLNEHGLKNFGDGERPTQLLLTFCRDTRRLTDVSYITP